MCVFVHRQVSLNEAAERYYGKAADLLLVRPAGGAHPVVCVGPNAPV